MSHQDLDRLTASIPHHQALRAALDWLCDSSALSGVRFQGDCSWTPKALVHAAILWAWSDEKTLTQRFRLARKIVVATEFRVCRPAATYQAFLKMLRTWTVRLVAILLPTFRRRMEGDLKDAFRWHGFTVFGVDGSRLALPRTRSHEDRFSPASPRIQPSAQARSRGRKRAAAGRPACAKILDCPQLWLTLMFHVGSGLPWDWRIGPTNSSERGHWMEMLGPLPADALVAADAGFAGYEYWRSLLESGRHLLIRVGSNVRLLRGLGYAVEREGLISLWPDREAKRGNPPLVLRLVTALGGRQPVYLVTSVEAERLSDRQVLEIYARRWGVELFYRHFKQTFERRTLRSRTADHVELEAAWSLIGLWAMMLRTKVELAANEIAPQRLSVARMLLAYRRSMREYKSRPDAGESLNESLRAAVMDAYRRRSKTSRSYPRKRKKQPNMVPEIAFASDVQIKLASELTNQPVLGLTA